MKTIQEFNLFNHKMNEAKSNKIDFQELDFQAFIDYLTMESDDFEKEYDFINDDKEAKLHMENVKRIANKCKVEKAFDGERVPLIENGYNLTKLVAKAKYKNIFVFSHNIGVPTTYFISSEYSNLDKLINMDSLQN